MNLSVFALFIAGGILVIVMGTQIIKAAEEHQKLSAQRQTECLAAGKSYIETAGITACLDKDASFELKRGGLFW